MIELNKMIILKLSCYIIFVKIPIYLCFYYFFYSYSTWPKQGLIKKHRNDRMVLQIITTQLLFVRFYWTQWQTLCENFFSLNKNWFKNLRFFFIDYNYFKFSYLLIKPLLVCLSTNYPINATQLDLIKNSN